MRAILLALTAVPLVAAPHASARQACRPVRTGRTQTFCGPARATLKEGGKKYFFRQGGNCSTDGSTWSLNIGTITLYGKPKKVYLGITVFSKKAGKHGAAVSWQLHGHSHSLLNAYVTLAQGLKKGTFTGRDPGAGKATGSFSCK
jgi:hypothetical protein